MKFEFLPCPIKYVAMVRKRSKSDAGEFLFALYDYFTEGKKHVFENEGMQMLYDLSLYDLNEFLANKKKLSETNANNASNRNNASKAKSMKPKKSLVATKVATDLFVMKATDAYEGNGIINDGNNGGNGCDDSETSSSDDGSDDATDDSDSSLSDENIKPPDIVRTVNARSKVESSLNTQDNKNDGNDRSESNINNDVANEICDCSCVHESSVISDCVSNRYNNELADSIAQLAPDAKAIATASTEELSTKDSVEETFARLRDLYNKTGDNESRAFELWQRLSAKEIADALSYAESIAGNSGYRSYLYVFLRDKEWLRPKANSH